jgi:hypothetical protein
MRDACESGAVSVLAESAGLAGHENVEGKASDTGEYTWIGSDTGSVFAHGDVAGVVGRIFNCPVGADGFCGAGGGEWSVGDVEGGLVGLAKQTGCRIANCDRALDPDDRGDMRVPTSVSERAGRIEDGDGAGFVAIAPAVAAMSDIARRNRRYNAFDRLFQRGLIVLDLDNQADFGGLRDGEEFFWQCSASRVTMASPAMPNAASSACAAEISLDFSSISTCASTSLVSVAKALSRCAAVRSWNLSKLPRRVLPSRATLPALGLALAAWSKAA